MNTYLSSINRKNTFIFIFIILFLFALSVSDDTVCTEQWTEINTSLENWLQKGDLVVTESIDGKPIFTYGLKNTSSENREYIGESWLKTDLSKNRGITVTFKPELYAYENEITNYPEGFAIVFTSSEPEKYNGGQNEGLGYEGIINGIAFEFDLIQNEAKGDLDKPHLSVNYNISGILTSSSKDRTDNLINIELPNFYDKTKNNYDTYIYFEIRVFNKKLTVTAKSTTDKILVETDFLQFQQLLENGDCSMGLTATGGGDSGVIIKNLKLEEISMNPKGYLEIENVVKDENDVPNVKAGEKITMDFYILSLCGEKLRIYLDEINANDFKLQINDENINPESISFDEDTSQIKIIFYLKVAKLYTAIIEFRGYDSYPLQFIVVPSDVSRVELCEHGSADETKYYSTSILDQSQEYFYIPLCVYDHLGNLKEKNIENIKNPKIKYPLNILPDETIDLTVDKTNKRILLKILFSTFGTYKIFCEDFIGEKIRYVNLLPEFISPEKSQVNILFEKNIIQDDTQKIYLRIKLRDNYNRHIPVVTLKQINCDFSQSEVTLISGTNKLTVSTEYKDDYVILSVNKPTTQGNYIFTPKVKCDNIDLIQLTCSTDSITKINNCEFFSPTNTINTNYIKLFDEISEDYITYSKSGPNTDYLYISLDEKDNKKLTDIILLDEYESNFLLNTAQTITATLGSDTLTVTQIGNKYDLILPSDKTRYDYTPVKLYDLKITLNTDNIFNIKVKFNFLDKYMTNVDISQTDTSKISYIAFYKQNSFTLEAQETLLLFEIYELSEQKYLGNIPSLLDETKVKVEINNEETTNCDIINHNNFFLSVICHDFTKAGEYSVSLKYDSNELITKELNIISQSDAYYLADEDGLLLESGSNIDIDRENLVKLIMLDKFENEISDNRIFNAFAKIKISENDVFYIKPNYDGKIHIFNQGNIAGESIALTLINGNTYNIESIYTPTFDDNLDPLNTYGILANEAPIIETNDDIALSLYLRDKYGNLIKGDVDLSVVNVYIEGKNLIEVLPMTSSQTSTTDGKIDYKASLTKNGDFLIKIFINNFPVECRGCHFKTNYIASEDYSKTSLFILGNKQKIPIFNSYSLSNKKVALVNKNNFFSFYLDRRDTNLNEIKRENTDDTITFNFESETSGIDTSSITLCETEKGYYELCENVFSSWSQLTDGIYIITNSDLNYKFYIYITDNELDSTNLTPTAANSYMYSPDNTLYGKLDAPASVVLDLRNSNYKRIDGFDKTKINIYNKSGLKNISMKIIDGTEKGLFIIFLIATKPDTWAFHIRYSSTNIISNVRYTCTCGSDIKLFFNGNDFLYNGNYVFFKLLDSKGNECNNIPYAWNPLNDKNFANSIFKAEKDGKIYKTETYYNHITNNFIIYLENYVTEQVDLSTNVYTYNDWDLDYLTTGLMENILDENHFYASISKEENKLNIKALNANYEPAFECFLEDTEFIVTLIRIINDDFVIINKDYEIEDDFCEFNINIESDTELIDAKGKYLYIVYYQGKEIFCENCFIDNSINKIDISKTKVYHKEGDNQYYQNDENTISHLFKMNLPFFKVNIMSEHDNLIILDSGLNIELKTLYDDGTTDITFNTHVKYSSNGNIYIYLDTEERDKYWALNTMQKIQLSITYNSNTFTSKYYVMDNYVKRLRANENCDTTVAPLIINKQSLYIKRYDEDMELEVRLSNCLKLNLENHETIKVFDTDGENQFNAELIPSDMPGSYYLFLPKNLEVNNSKKYYLLNNYNIKSEEFELSVIPGYDIAKIEFKNDENMAESGTDKIYTYFLIKMKDKYDNVITNVGRNLFVNDIFAFSVNSIPYKLSYDEKLKAFRCQVPLFTSGELNVQSLISDDTFEVEIESPQVFRKSLVTLDSENNNLFTFSFNLKDDVYNDATSEDYSSEVSFKYITINLITEQIFIREVSSNYLGNNKFSVQLDNSFPKYTFYGFIPYIEFFPQICPSCMIKNLYPENIYLLKYDSIYKYEPHNINKNLYLIQNYEYLTFIYLAHGDITIESSDVSINQILSTDITKLYYLVYNGESENININITTDNNKIIFNALFIDYTSTTTESTIPSYVEIYGDNIYSPNLGDSKYISFFIETRDDTGKLISTKPNLYKDDTFSNLIDSIQVINTLYTGVYYVEITLAKSSNLDFYLKFSESQTKSSNDNIIYINSIPAFPTYISLENKEVVSKNNIKYILYTHNDHNEAVCDERLNIYMEDMNLKGSHFTLDYYNNQCELYLIFGGYATIRSNINNYVTEINNNDKSLYNISPQFSTVSITPNVFNSEGQTLTIKFIEKSPTKNIYGSNEFNGDKSLMIYKYISPNKFQLDNSFTNLLSNEYTFNPNNLGIINREVYIIIGSVVDSTLSPIFAYFQPEQPESNDIKGIESIYFNDEQKYNVLTNFMINKVYTGETLELIIPLLFRIKFLDGKGNDMSITSEEGKKYYAKLILANDDEEKKSIDLILRQFNDKYFYIQSNPSSIVNIIHLPVYLTDDSLKYFIKIQYDTTISLYSLLSLENRDYIQSPSIKNRYSNSNTFTSFSIYTNLHEQTISIPKQKSNINYICLYITEDSEEVILNEHLDLYSTTTQININDCSDFKYANSYMGCFELYINCDNPSNVDMKLSVKYNNIDSSSQISINIYDSSNFAFTLNNAESSSSVVYTGDSTQTQPNIYFTATINSLSIELFKTFINGEKIENVQISNPSSSSWNVLKFILPYKYFDTKPKTKNIQILYEDGSNTKKLLFNEEYSITVNQKDYAISLVDDYYTFKIQDPLNLFIGEKIAFYLLIYDKNNACFYGDFSKLSNIEITIKKGEVSYKAKIKSREQIEGYSQCEYIYLVEYAETITTAGDYDLTITEGNSVSLFDSKIHISNKDIDETKSKIEGEQSEVQAGNNIYLTFSGTDIGGNAINFYDIIDNIDIALIDSEGNVVEKIESNYYYDIKVNSDNTGIEIYLKINNYGTYSLQILKNGVKMNLPNEYTISVKPLECSMNSPELNLLKNEEREEYYYNERITMEIKCKDIFGNHVKERGKEIFKLYALSEENEVFEFDEHFKNELHYIYFSLENPGKYTIDVTLNGKKYGESLELEIKSIDTSNYICMDKSQVEKLEDCDTSAYRAFLQSLLGSEYICLNPTTQGALFKCDASDIECVVNTNVCDCQGEPWQGYCYPNDNNPISKVTEDLVTCISKINNAVSCGDGSCRFNKEECLTDFECPLGYKSCGNKCILLNQNCIVNKVCGNNEVLCWDLTCATGYDNCPTRITCPENKVLCPDNTCQLSGHCIQPSIRYCDTDEYQCSDFSCVTNEDDCPKNIVCDPGYSLCENKTCNLYCKGEINTADTTGDKDDKNNKNALIGGLVGGIGGAAIIGFSVFYFFFWRKRKIKRAEEVDLNTAEQNLNLAKDKPKVTVYNKKDITKDNNNIEHSDIDEIKEETNNPNRENTEQFRSIKNVK